MIRSNVRASPLPWLALGALLWAGWRYCAQLDRQRRQSLSAAAPEPVQRWEGEGGQSQELASGMLPDEPPP